MGDQLWKESNLRRTLQCLTEKLWPWEQTLREAFAIFLI